MNTTEQTFSVNEVVIYSDLSPWEIAKIVKFRSNGNVDLEFEDGIVEDCMYDGMRKLTSDNYKKYVA